MEKFWKSAPWIIRLILLPPTVIFTLIAIRYITHPVASAAAQGIAFNSGLGVTIARVGFGGFPLACAIFLATCLVSRHRLLTGLTFVSIIVGVVLLVRIFGMMADSSTAENMRLVRPEIGLLLVTGIGLTIEVGRRAYLRRMQQSKA
jgi:hypothetical protein